MDRKINAMLLGSILFLVACAKEPPPRSVQDFLDNPQFLEAAVVRCSQNRSGTRYDKECMNARQAVSLIEAREERARREKLEAASEKKRDALRRTQRAAAEARRRAAEREALRKEAEYLAQFGEQPEAKSEPSELEIEANVPGAVIPAPADNPPPASEPLPEEPVVVFDEPEERPATEPSAPAVDGGNAPVAQQQ